MAKMVTLKPHRFAGRQRIAGEKYEANGQAKRLSEALGWAEEAKPDPVLLPPKVMAPRQAQRPAAPPREASADAAASETPATAAQTDAPPQQPADGSEGEASVMKPRRTYNRRNLTAEE